MRAIHLADFAAPYPGSFVPLLIEVSAECRSRGMDPEIVLPPAAAERTWIAELEHNGIPVSHAPVMERRAITEWLRRKLADDVPTVMHTHFTRFDMASLAVRRDRLKTRLIWHLHSRMSPSLRARTRARVKFRVASDDVDAMLCAGPQVEAAAIARGAPPIRTRSMPSAIDLEHFVETTVELRRSIRERYGIPDDRYVLLHFGWDWEVKGGDLVLDAFDLLRGEGGTEPFIVLVGAGEAGRNALAARGLEDHGRVVDPVSEVRRIYALADVFVSGSRAEGDPYAILEALACGLPVAAVRLPGLAEAAAGIEMLSLLDDFPAALADGIRQIRGRERDTAADMVRSAREWLWAHRSLKARAVELVDVYEALWEAS